MSGYAAKVFHSTAIGVADPDPQKRMVNLAALCAYAIGKKDPDALQELRMVAETPAGYGELVLLSQKPCEPCAPYAQEALKLFQGS